MQYEKQYRQAVMSESIVVYQVNFSKDLIEEEFSQRTEDDEEVKVLSAVSLHAPCSYNEYCLRWSRRVADDCMSAYRRLDTCEKLLKIYARGITSASIEYRTRDATEKGIWVNKTVQMMEDEETKDILGLVCLKDITKQREKEIYAREMRKKATMDLMTGLLNHVSGEMAIRERLLSRQDQEYALFVFDVDEFKSINDRRGHQFGDAVLKKTADMLLSVCRMKDVAVRMGGDEFVLFMEMPQDLHAVADRVFKSLCFYYEDIYSCVSMGISTTTVCGRDYGKLFFCADQAMYISKRAGKGRYTIYTEELNEEKKPHETDRTLGDFLLQKDTFAAVRELLQTYSECMNDYLYIYDMIRDIYYISDRAVERFAIPAQSFTHVLETHCQFVYEPDQRELMVQLKALSRGEMEEHNICYRWMSRSRQPVWINCKGKVIRQSNGEPAFLIGCINEIGTRQIADNVSGLLGEASFETRYEEVLKDSGRGFILRIGIDEFREINEQFGGKYGDFILRSTVISMEEVISDGHELFRMLGDEFVVIDYAGGVSEAKSLFQKIRCSIEEMIGNMSYEVFFTISAGILEAEDYRGCGYSAAMKKSQFALGRAKAAGRNQAYVFQSEDFLQSFNRSLLLQEMRNSVKNNFVGFEVLFQPIVDAATHRMYCAEALLRYTRESGERVSPVEFIPLLEQSGLIVPVGRWVAERSAEACRQCRLLKPEFRISVNLSPVQLQKSAVYSDFKNILDENQLPYDAMIVELTETQLLDNNQIVRKTWDRMRDSGFLVAVDDFGTGYSNFINISVIKPNIIKLDKDFTFRAMENSFDHKLMKSMIELAHEIGVRVCVEGIENETYAETVQKLGSELLQGYYFGYPLHLSRILKALQEKE